MEINGVQQRILPYKYKASNTDAPKMSRGRKYFAYEQIIMPFVPYIYFLLRYDTVGVAIREVTYNLTREVKHKRVFFSLCVLASTSNDIPSGRFFLLCCQMMTLCTTWLDHWFVLDTQSEEVYILTEKKLQNCFYCDTAAVVKREDYDKYLQIYAIYVERHSYIYNLKHGRRRDSHDPESRVRNLKEGEVDASVI
ncbi:hypothetical protein B484DRAFT_434139 [Ochromonadaceae sp. CCMP2298]|nr:hypothetical protein B484DRAFT_434139 [Ochromonadaceae sp. CCMP2298]